MGLAEENREENIIEKDGGELEVPANADLEEETGRQLSAIDGVIRVRVVR